MMVSMVYDLSYKRYTNASSCNTHLLKMGSFGQDGVRSRSPKRVTSAETSEMLKEYSSG